MHQSPGSCTTNVTIVTDEVGKERGGSPSQKRETAKGASARDTRRAENLKKLEIKPGCCAATARVGEKRHSSAPSFVGSPRASFLPTSLITQQMNHKSCVSQIILYVSDEEMDCCVLILYMSRPHLGFLNIFVNRSCLPR